MSANAVTIYGTGRYLPEQCMSANAVDHLLGWPKGQSFARFGIANRYVANQDETSSFMATRAAQLALKAAQCDAKDIDLILGACGVMEQPIPSTAVLVQDRLGLGKSGIPAFDVNATCLSFLQALDVAALWIQSGRARRVLVFSSDIASSGLDWKNPESAAIFGDGAAAVIVGPGDGAILAHGFETYSEGREACVLAAGGTRINPTRGIAEGDDKFRMDGGKAFRVTSRYLPGFLSRLLARAGVDKENLDCIIPHQASAHALQHAIRALRFPAEKVVNIFAQTGNQIASSIPSALDHAVQSGALKRGQTALLIGTSAGISLGGTVVRF
ncbi:3-oxoacyl-[acyl-carrier-protein] synthase III C-terminal domain-containing protein [Thalassospira sp. TSL5-1]|uniref:3-oxoacyl-[acyl-carrier-protein] synthase III C-terminal domain-containing protein n=1 Tax=Thalassospira sp. TSL5-1 TaxID=1544451 RepID=UPI000939B463|nr:3-oxoacyl-[acyl-carrier-protein] synthase III C-terminal domain-containing protein [Thalassospira sp. TSL5-1]OKH90209.1 3-oxoacyl-ACP synthase [Thalassospira sp. TSL5-1]